MRMRYPPVQQDTICNESTQEQTRSESSYCRADTPDKLEVDDLKGEFHRASSPEPLREEVYEIVEEIIVDGDDDEDEVEVIEEIVEIEIDDESEQSEEEEHENMAHISEETEDLQLLPEDSENYAVESEHFSGKAVERPLEKIVDQKLQVNANSVDGNGEKEDDKVIEQSASQISKAVPQLETTDIQDVQSTKTHDMAPTFELEMISFSEQHQDAYESAHSSSSLDHNESEPRMRAPSISAPNSPSRRWRSPERKREKSEERSQVEPKEYTWEKPAWTKASLKSTGKGAYLKQGSDLQSPITHIPKTSDHTNKEANSSILRSTISPPITPKAYEWKKPTWTKAQLRATGKGEYVRKGSDLQAPITHVQKNTMVDINFEANPMVLRPTDKGTSVRLGENLAKPITHCEKNPMADVNFEANPAFVLQETDYGKKVKSGNSLAKPVTFPEKRISDVNFDANPAVLKRTEKGKLMKEKGDLQGPITHVEKNSMDDINFEANPMVLKSTEKGKTVRMGEKLERPITHIAKSIKD